VVTVDDAPMAVGGGSFGGLGSPPEMIGLGLDEADSVAVLDRAFALGMTLIDTAHSYADGAADQAIGAWLRADQTRRDAIAVVAKLGIVRRSGELALDLNPANVERCARESRARLGIERVAVVMSHAPDPETPIAATLDAFVGLMNAGYADSYGISNVEIADLDAWLSTAEQIGAPQPVLVENEYSLLRRTDETDVLPLCRERGIGYLAHSPLASGLLSGKYRSGVAPPQGSYLAIRPEDRFELLASLPPGALERFAEIATKREMTNSALALAWVAAQPGIRPIVGVRRVEQLSAAEQALANPLTPEDAAEVAALFEAV
jgi:aryl-alcohol dehydrogenase-like predicted oxidoreductase